MENISNNPQNQYEHVVRDAVLAQLTNDKMVDAITAAVLSHMEQQEDQHLLHMLKNQDASSQETIGVEQFIEALKTGS